MFSIRKFHGLMLARLAVVLGAGVVFGHLAQASDGPFEFEAKILASEGSEYDHFGSVVRMSGQWAVVSAPYHDGLRSGRTPPVGVEAAGAVYVLQRQESGQWLEHTILLGGWYRDYFGVDVAISGRRIVVGAHEDDTPQNGNNCGSAEVFVLDSNNQWVTETKLLDSEGGPDERFGRSVAIDEETIAVWARGDISVPNAEPSVVIFERRPTGWHEVQRLQIDGARLFGAEIAIHENVLLIADPFDDTFGPWTGAVYVFAREGGIWVEKQKLFASDAVGDSAFGSSVDIDSDRAVIGAYDLDDETGAAYVFGVGSDGIWREEAKLVAGDRMPEDHFGEAVTIEDGTIVVGAHNVGWFQGSAYVFARQSNGTWVETQELASNEVARLGASLDLEGEDLLIGAWGDSENGFDAGAAFHYVRQLFEPIFNPISGSYFQLSYAPRGINWYEARDAAERMAFNGMAGHLATYASAEEENFVIGAFPEIEPNYVWLGASDEASEADWWWVTGEPWYYVNWDSGEPNGGTYENCLDYSDGVTRWNDETCSRRIYYYLVEFPLTSKFVAIDFKPGNRRNVINPRSKGRFWLAILSDEAFDALQVDPETVALGPAEASPDRYRVRDVNRDRLPDLMLRFKTPEVGIQCGDTELQLTGATYAGDSITGTDAVKTVGCKKPKKGNKK